MKPNCRNSDFQFWAFARAAAVERSSSKASSRNYLLLVFSCDLHGSLVFRRVIIVAVFVGGRQITDKELDGAEAYSSGNAIDLKFKTPVMHCLPPPPPLPP